MRSKKLCLLFFIQVSSLLGVVTSAWNGTSDDLWSTSGNWTNAVPQGIDDEANFNTPSNTNPNPSITSSVILGTLLFDSTVAHTISLGVGGSLAFQASSGSAAITVDDTNGAGIHSISAGFTLTSPVALTQSSSANFTLSGNLAGTGALTKTGTGLLTLSGNNTSFTGGLIINQGMVTISSNTNLGASSTATTIGAGTLQITSNVTTTRNFSLTGAAAIDSQALVTLSGVISGSGSLTTSGSTTLTLSGTNTYLGGTTISSGTLSVGSDSNLGDTRSSLAISGGTLLFGSGGFNSARDLSITSASTINTGGYAPVLTGAISGSGTLSITGGGSLTFTGAGGQSSYSGTTSLAASTTFTGTTLGIQGAISFTDSSSILTFNQNIDGTYSGALSGVGTVTKTGSGTVTFSGSSSSFTGEVTISQGTLNVTGSLSNANLISIESNGTLTGTGTVGPTTSTGGTIDPGTTSGAGTLSINGALSLDANSTVNITINPTSADTIAASGAAAIDGALSVEVSSGFYGFEQDYTIITSSSRSGSFDTVTSSLSGFVPSLSYTATAALLHINIERPFSYLPLTNFNTIAVGNDIDDLHVAGELSTQLLNIVESFVGLSTDTINNALDQMHPAPYTAFTEMQVENGSQLLSLFHRLPYLPCCCNNPNRFWIEPFGNTLTMKSKGIELGFQANTLGVAFGYDRQIGDNLVLGLGGAWNYNELNWHHHRGHGETNGFYGGLYFDSQFDAFFLGATFLAGADFYNTSRHIEFVSTNEHAAANYQALDLMAQIKMAYLFGSPQAFFYPYANIDYLYLQTNSISEDGAGGLNLSVEGYGDGTLRTEMGLGFQVQDRNWDETMCISPQISLGWVGMWPLQRPLIQAAFQGTTIPFKVKGWDESWNLLKADFGLTISYRCYSLKLQYDVEISPDSDTTLFSQHGNIRFDWKW